MKFVSRSKETTSLGPNRVYKQKLKRGGTRPKELSRSDHAKQPEAPHWPARSSINKLKAGHNVKVYISESVFLRNGMACVSINASANGPARQKYINQ